MSDRTRYVTWRDNGGNGKRHPSKQTHDDNRPTFTPRPRIRILPHLVSRVGVIMLPWTPGTGQRQRPPSLESGPTIGSHAKYPLGRGLRVLRTAQKIRGMGELGLGFGLWAMADWIGLLLD